MWDALEISGKDARDFLHRLSTAHVRNLKTGEFARALLLQAQAKVIGAFTILALGEEKFLLVFSSREEFQAVSSQLEKLHFAEQLEFRELRGHSGIRVSSLVGAQFVQDKTFVEWPLLGNGYSFLFGEKIPEVLSEEAAEKCRVNIGIPKFGQEYTAETNALDAGLLPWIHQNKGCYPGQEVVERSLSVGHPARALVKLRSDAECNVGDDLFVGEIKVGRITSASGNLFLAIVQWKHQETLSFQSKDGELQCRK